MTRSLLAPLPETWPATRATLHAYTRVVGVVPRVHAIAHPRWWHVSLEVRPTGLVPDPIPVAGGGSLQLRMDLRSHSVFLERSDGSQRRFPMDEGLSGSAFGDRLLRALGETGIVGDYERSRFEDEEAGSYDPAAAAAFFDVLVNVDGMFRRYRAGLDGNPGPVQFWPHGFDLAFEWFGTRMIEHEEAQEAGPMQAQINLGFFSGARPYFYSNPWPLDPALTSVALPHGAEWHVEGWQGSVLYYDQLTGDPAAATKLAEYATAVHAAAAPGLMAR